jgi:hypothetical protein
MLDNITLPTQEDIEREAAQYIILQVKRYADEEGLIYNYRHHVDIEV